MLTTWEFVDVLAESNLLSPDLLARIRNRVTESGGRVDPRSVAKYLIDKGHLTLWQSNQLLAGRKAFFLGRYKLLDRVGKGGMGVVFKARHAVMDRVVALKVMSRSLLNNPQAVARFNREVKTAAALNHPNIITAYDADAVGNTHFLVMEFIDGRDLNAWLKARGPFPIGAACECAMQAAEGLAYANRQGMVHRDIKPVNLLVTWDAQARRPNVKILDLGLARFVSESQEDAGLTRVGQTIGTPDYLAPEAAESFRDADIRADIFSLGCALFKLLTGRLPFPGDNTLEKLVARTTRDAPSVRGFRPEIPVELDAVLAKMLARNVKDRYQTPAELVVALTPFSPAVTGDRESLEFFSEVLPAQPSLSAAEIEADADTSLADFFRDFSVSPLREERPPAARPSPKGGELELVPIDEDQGKTPKTSTVVAPDEPVEAKPDRSVRTERDDRKRSKSRPIDKNREAADDDDLVATDGEPDGTLVSAGRGSQARRRVTSLASIPNASPKQSRKGWDSPLMLVGGGTLLLLILAAGALYWSVHRSSGDKLFETAMELYKQGNYPLAIADFDTLLTQYSSHREAANARVWRGLAKMRKAGADGSDPSQALEQTQSALTEISGEESFGEVRTEVAAILPATADGLGRQAAKQKQAKLVDDGRAVLAMVDKYVPKELRPTQRLDQVTHSLDSISRVIARDSALEKTIADMRTAAESDKTADAYLLRKELLKTYPDLAGNEKLREAVLAVAAAEQKAVVVDNTPLAAVTGEPESPLAGTMSLANRQGQNAPGVDGQIVYGVTAGYAYGVDATTGNLLWRRNVGADATAAPSSVSAEATADALMIDASRQELWRVEAASGKARWRAPLNAATVGRPLVADDRVWLATKPGGLLAIDLSTGERRMAIQLPQKLTTGPTLAADKKHLYQAGEHSSLFVLSAESGQCEELFYLGHAAGTIATPPVAVSRYLYVAENNRLDNGQLRVLLADDKGLALKEIKQIGIDGHIRVAPQVVDRALFVVSDLGAIYAFEVGTPDKAEPLTKIADVPATSQEHRQRLFAVRSNRLWVAADQLLRYDVQLAKGRLTAGADRYRGDNFQEPLAIVGGVLVSARQKVGQSGLLIAAVDVNSGDPFWETELAAPVASLIPDFSSKLLALNTSGALFQLTDAAVADRQVTSTPTALVGSGVSLGADYRSFPIDRQTIAICRGAPDPQGFLVKDGGNEKTTVRPMPDGTDWSAMPAPFAAGLVVPTRAGIVRWISTSGQPTSLQPFEPERLLGRTSHWQAPLAVGEGQLLLLDDQTQLYLLGRKEKPLPHLARIREATLTVPIVSPLAVAGNTVYGVDAQDHLTMLSLADLKIIQATKLPAALAWGPHTIENRVYLTTDNGELLCFDGSPEPSWKREFTGGPLVGIAPSGDQQLVCAFAGGTVVWLDRASGNPISTVDVGERLAGPPLPQAGHVVLAAADGSLLWMPVPQ